MKLPEDVREQLLKNEWHHQTHFRNRMMGGRNSVELALKPPTGKAVLEDLAGFRRFVDAWTNESVRQPGLVTFETRILQTVGSQSVPTQVKLSSTLEIAKFIGMIALDRLRAVRDRLLPFEAVAPELRKAAERFIHPIEALSVEVCRQIAEVIRQMQRGMGLGLYLRALPLDGIDTKLVERHRPLIEKLLNDWLGGEVKEAGGLIAWLGCLTKGEDRVMLRALCPEARARLWNLDPLWISTDTLARASIQAERLLIVENDISGLILPQLAGTVAVIGCGGNLAWLTADWVQSMRVGYWGDLDTWGLRLLARARTAIPVIEPLMMDLATWEQHPAAIVMEHEPCEAPAAGLTETELDLFHFIRGCSNGSGRVEQEKLSASWVSACIAAWATS